MMALYRLKMCAHVISSHTLLFFYLLMVIFCPSTQFFIFFMLDADHLFLLRFYFGKLNYVKIIYFKKVFFLKNHLCHLIEHFSCKNKRKQTKDKKGQKNEQTNNNNKQHKTNGQTVTHFSFGGRYMYFKV